MKTSEQLDKIAPALAKAQGLIEGAVKDKTNPAFRSKYADLGACWDACRKELTDNGISVIQANVPATDGITITTRLLHASGQWIEDDGLYLPATKKDAQGFGSAMTYARRYALCAMVGIAPEDDDGNAASKPKAKAETGVSGPITPTTGVWEELGETEREFLEPIARDVIGLIYSGDIGAACDRIDSEKLDATMKTALWTRFDSKQRAAMKAHMQKLAGARA